MVVITLTDVPQSLRGDLTKWLFEINVGVYVGQISARVRDELWTRIVENAKVGRVTMVYQTNNEQHFAYRVHNSEWKPIDFDGLTLMMRPNTEKTETNRLRPGFSNAAHRRLANRIQMAEKKKVKPEQVDSDKESDENTSNSSSCIPSKSSTTAIIESSEIDNDITHSHVDLDISFRNYNKRNTEYAHKQSINEDHSTYVVIDLETTGLDETENEIIEFGALRIVNGKISDQFQKLVLIENDIPPFITKLTGISDELLDEEGEELSDILDDFIAFIGNNLLVAHNISFDIKFLNYALSSLGRPKISNRLKCTYEMSKILFPSMKTRKLAAICKELDIDGGSMHRSLSDCECVYRIYEHMLYLTEQRKHHPRKP